MIDLNDTALPRIPSKCRVTLLALGDVGSTLLTGLRLMGGDCEIIALGVGYARIFLLFTPFFMCNYIVSAFVRNDGDPSLAMVATLSGSLFNVVFDYIFMFPLGLGLAGAALATTIALYLSWLTSILYARRNYEGLQFPLLPHGYDKAQLEYAMAGGKFYCLMAGYAMGCAAVKDGKDGVQAVVCELLPGTEGLGALAEKRGAGKYEVVSSLPGEDGETWCMLKWLGRAYPELEPVYMGFSLE